MAEEKLLGVKELAVFYGASQILFGVDLAVEEGRTLALLGRNGAGKSTTLKALAGVVKPSSGSVALRGQEIAGWASDRIARGGMGYVPEDRQVFKNHSVEDNLKLAVKKGVRGQEDWNLDRVYEAFPLLLPLSQRKAGLLSGGEQQMLTIARTLMGNPEILLLDEPSEGLAPIIVQAIAGLIKDLKKSGVTILLAEQNMRFCLKVADDAAVIDKGRIVFQGSIAELREREDVTKRYLAI
ncbi:MAG TPA: ABC transporter ATP-binding protein [Alphaproteobacteria bacterium]|nr:ABC transporter ATP-binding protein [Paracoccaceae bacterium]RCL80682.1 MAG: ABC transporter ATP-binding protein [SAR116 cluster bacterium]HCJ61889.1 ABC transporter ATP-binding protein [Alphaproteobacteria bacterium]HCY47442.1 ABC transporter ATP-binding protein [Alphaproteobacteria bacterium]|tara:strand:- start:1043 stop:1759 length:717 start_codon:yes stop_codon:yes gene_type:complete